MKLEWRRIRQMFEYVHDKQMDQSQQIFNIIIAKSI